MNKKLFIIIATIIIALIIVLTFFYIKGLDNKPEEYVDETAYASSGRIESSRSREKIAVSGDLNVYFFDVGQAESIFVENNGKTMLIDAGNNPDGKYISKYLRKELGIKTIDYLIGTHPHEDHIGGLDIIIEDFNIGNLYMPSKSVENKTYEDVIKIANKKGIKIISPEIGTKFNVGTAKCTIMTQNDNAEDINETSIVIEMSFGIKKFLFTADMLGLNEKTRIWNDIDVLKVAHHGSIYSSEESFLKQVKPEIAIITCGKDNDYHYPHEGVLKRLEEIGCKDVYITKDDGTILLTCDGTNINVKCLPELRLDGNQ